MRLITRGLGGGPVAGLIVQGMTKALELIRIVRGGGRSAKKIYDHLIDNFIIAVKLIEINGKEIFKPIFNKRKFIVDFNKENNVIVENVNIKKMNSKQNEYTVKAKLTRVKRGLNGKH